MSDINPNTPVTENDPTVSLSGGESPASFDELEQIMSNKVSSQKTGKAKTDEGEKGQKTSMDLSNSDPAKGGSKDKGGKAEAKKDAKDGEGKPTDEQKAKTAEALAQARKAFKGKFGDKELEVDEDTEFTVKINGQEVPVKAKDLFTNYSGKVAWDKKFSEIDKERRSFKAEQGKFDSIKSQVREMFEEKDPTVRLFKMSQIAGVDPMTFRKNFFDDMSKEVETWLAMTDDERKARDLEFENRYLKYQADAAQKTLKERQFLEEVDTKVKGLLQKTNVAPESFVSRYEELASLDSNAKAMLEREGKMFGGKPSPEFIVETIQKDALWESAASAFEGVKHQMDENKLTKTMLELVESAYTNGLKPEDMPDIVSELWGKGRAKRVVDQVEKERQQYYEGQRPVVRESQNLDVWSLDQL